MNTEIPHGFENGPGPGELWTEWHARLMAYEASMQAERQQLALQLDGQRENRRQAYDEALQRVWRKRRPWLIGSVLALVVGAIFLLIGAEMNSPMAEPATPGSPEVAVGLVLIFGVIALALCSLVRFSIIDMIAISRYIREWKKTATPEQLAAYYATQAAVMWGAHIALRHSNEESRRRAAERSARFYYIKHYVHATPEQRATMTPPPGMSSAWGG